jgi:iron complex outermembrane recepter protein
VRASGFRLRDPGYIDNVRTGEHDVNRRDAQGGRLSALWRPNERFSLKLSALKQDSDRRGPADVNRALLLASGTPQQSTIPSTGIYDRRTEAYSATMAGKLGRIDLSSVTGYTIDEVFSRIDTSFFCPIIPGGGCVGNFGPSATGAVTPFPIETAKFTQEIRASIPLGSRVDWLVGAYYTDEDLDTQTAILAVNPNTGVVAGSALEGFNTNAYQEYALFTNFTFDVTDRFDVQVGGRASRNELDFSVVRLPGPFFGAVPVQPPFVQSSDTPFTYLLTPRFKVSPDLMMYARVASGYRPGGNNNCSIAVPCSYKADTTRNYEIGLKGDVLDDLLSFNAALYHIDWEDIQLQLNFNGNANFPFTGNAGRATSTGVELSVEARPLTGMTLTAWVVRGEAQLAEDLPPTQGSVGVGRDGDNLPDSSRFSAFFSAKQEFPLGLRVKGFVEGSWSYMGERPGAFRSSLAAPRFVSPSYKMIDVRVGAELGTWTVDAFANNVADERAVLTGDPVLSPNFYYTTPRTIGLNLSKAF